MRNLTQKLTLFILAIAMFSIAGIPAIAQTDPAVTLIETPGILLYPTRQCNARQSIRRDYSNGFTSTR